MDPLVTSALVSSGASILGNIFNVFGQKSANSQNMELAKYQFEKNLEMWNLQNEYNLPINQMKRLREAGINPVIAYSGGQVSGNVAQDVPKYDAPVIQPYQVDSSGLASIGASYVQARATEQTMELQKSQVELNRAKVATENMVALLRELQGTRQFMDNQYFQSVAPILKDTLKANLDLLHSKKTYTDKEIETMSYNLEHILPAQEKSILSSVRNMDVSTRRIVLQSISQQIQNELLSAELPYADSMAYSKSNLMSQQLLGFSKLNNIRDLEKLMKEMQNSAYPIELRMKIASILLKGFSVGASLGF